MDQTQLFSLLKWLVPSESSELKGFFWFFFQINVKQKLQKATVCLAAAAKKPLQTFSSILPPTAETFVCVCVCFLGSHTLSICSALRQQLSVCLAGKWTTSQSVIYGGEYLCSCNTILPSSLSPSLQSTFVRSGSCGWGRAPVILSATQRRLVNWTLPTASSCFTAWSSASGRSVWPVSVCIYCTV